MILKNIKAGSVEDIQVGHLRFKIVADSLAVNLINLHVIDGLIIKNDDVQEVRRILHQVRVKSDPLIYLLPIYLNSNKLFRRLGNEIDGYIKDEVNTILSHNGQSIKDRISTIERSLDNEEDFKIKNTIKALHYAYTRNVSLTPYRDRTSPVGYHIPFLSSIVSDGEIVSYLQLLDKWSAKSKLTTYLIDKVNCCNTCYSSYLNFHETCSKCSSIELNYENLIHHFRCAYIGPESDFKKGDHLECPKCDKALNHIGIDYDKPAEIAKCKCCGHTSQETKMKARCVDCGEHNDLSQLNTLLIKRYELTAQGIDWIIKEQGSTEDGSENLKDLRIVPAPIFNLLLEQEKSRSSLRTSGSSFAGEINLDDSIFESLNDAFRNQLKQEVLKILSTYLRPIDILSSQDTGKYRFLLPDINQKKAYDIYLLLLDNLNKILADNISESAQKVTGDLRKL